MTSQELRTKETLKFLENSDLSLGFRRLLDCVADTQNMDLFKEAISLNDWKEQHPTDALELVVRSKSLLSKASKIELTEHRSVAPVVQAVGIAKQYRKGGFSLGPVSLEMTKGQVYGLVGENGNGKTTLLRMLAGELRRDNGQLEFNLNNAGNSRFDLRTRLAYIPQRTQRWYGSLKSNLKFVLSSYNTAPHENEVRTLFMIARLGLWKYRNLQWSELSSGYKMRFELARTLLRKPELLLLDEPLANLDVLAQQIILEDLKSIASSINNPIALILSSQQLYEVEKISDSVIYLKNGQLAANENETTSEQTLIVEIETTAERVALMAALEQTTPQKVSYNGGVYIAYFEETTFSEVLLALGTNNIQVTYIRNISKSTRKYFVE